MKRIFLVVLDSFGIGELPDAAAFGDVGANTLKSIMTSPHFVAPSLTRMGLFHAAGIADKSALAPIAAYGKCAERSAGKDTTIGHWELCGLVSPSPMPVYPNGFPKEIIEEFSRETGRGVLCNAPFSGTAVIAKYGKEHEETGNLIVYTSADSVFQIAAHEDVVPIEQLYEYCRAARRILTGKHAVGRVIARPFVGCEGNYTRTDRRRDFSVEPPAPTLLDAVSGAGLSCIAVGKISDIFCGRGITESIPTHGNVEGMQLLASLVARDFSGLAFVNLVDFDMHYGHRRDIDGYARAISEFDAFLAKLLPCLRDEDLLIVTADHGCDPGYLKTTDHTREYIPVLAFGKGIAPRLIGTRDSFADVGATVAAVLDVPYQGAGKSFL
ncbi:MAG: phosphopentomutase [Clostridia bacterium]|nr:phosphopentomutase [Clostridia bacterium]